MTGPADQGPWAIVDAEVAGVDALKERLSTLLSVVALLAIAGGTGWGLWEHIGPWSLVAAGFLMACMVGYTDYARRPPESETVTPQPKRVPLPGPSHAGNLHVKGPGASA
jgi:hypothetical protein